MASLRENGRAGAVAFTLLGIGCLSTDEPLFRAVVAPASDSDSAARAALDSAALDTASPNDVAAPLRAEEELAGDLELAPSPAEDEEQATAEATTRAEAELPPVATPVMPPRDSCGE